MRPKAPSPEADAAAQFPSPIPGFLGGSALHPGSSPAPLTWFDRFGRRLRHVASRGELDPSDHAPRESLPRPASRRPRSARLRSPIWQRRACPGTCTHTPGSASRAPDQPELLAARAPADQEVVASSQRADWLFAAAGARGRSRRREGAPETPSPAGSRARSRKGWTLREARARSRAPPRPRLGPGVRQRLEPRPVGKRRAARPRPSGERAPRAASVLNRLALAALWAGFDLVPGEYCLTPPCKLV